MKKNKSTKGFTLMEFIVGAALFSLVVVVVAGIFSSAIKGQRRAIAIQNVQGNARYLMGFMAKEIRMSEFQGSDGETTMLYIIHPVNGNVTYSFSANQIRRLGEPISSDEIKVTGKFLLEGIGKGDGKQAKITIIMQVEGKGVKAEEKARINLQATLSQRNL